MNGDRQDTLSTYRHLRLSMALVLGMLLVAVGLRALSAGGCFEGSISAYYFTSVRAVFVAALCALGTCLIVYRGNTDPEDIALNASGALAFVVAFVPTGPPDPARVACTASNVPSTSELEAAVNNNMVALIIVSLVALVVGIILVGRSAAVPSLPLPALLIFSVVLCVGSASFAVWPAGFRDNAHTAAAIAMFIGILAVVGLNALGADQAREGDASSVRYRNTYAGIALAMLFSALVIVGVYLLMSDWRHAVLVIEAMLLFGFLIFWLTQTAELWHRTRRGDPAVTTPGIKA